MIKLPCTGKEMVDYIADYLENIRDRRVFPEVDKIIALDDHFILFVLGGGFIMVLVFEIE